MTGDELNHFMRGTEKAGLEIRPADAEYSGVQGNPKKKKKRGGGMGEDTKVGGLGPNGFRWDKSLSFRGRPYPFFICTIPRSG